MGKRIIGAIGASFPSKDDPGVLVDAEQGEEVDLSTSEEERLEGLGVLVPEGLSVDDYLDAKMDLYRAERGDSEAAQKLAAARSGGIVDLSTPGEPPPDEVPTPPAGGEVAALADQIRDEGLTVEETVSLASDDPEKAKQVLEAERVASGGQPRRGVENRLNVIIEG